MAVSRKQSKQIPAGLFMLSLLGITLLVTVFFILYGNSFDIRQHAQEGPYNTPTPINPTAMTLCTFVCNYSTCYCPSSLNCYKKNQYIVRGQTCNVGDPGLPPIEYPHMTNCTDLCSNTTGRGAYSCFCPSSLGCYQKDRLIRVGQSCQRR